MLLGADDLDGASFQQNGYDFVETRNKLFKAVRQNDFAKVKSLITMCCDADQSSDNVLKSKSPLIELDFLVVVLRKRDAEGKSMF